MVGGAGEGEGLVGLQGVLFGIHLLGGGELVGRKKLLRAAATGSTLAVIAPIDFGHVL